MYCSFHKNTHILPPPPISWLPIRHPPSQRAPPASCGGPCSTPGPLFLQLFGIFLLSSYVHSTSLSPSAHPPPQTNAAGLRFVVTAGRPVRTAALHQDNSGLYAFMKLTNTHLNTPQFISSLPLQRFPLKLTFSACIRLHLKCIVVHI